MTEDRHVHSTFSDGTHTLDENVERALSLGLSCICCVDHVRHDTTWVPAFAHAVADLRARYKNQITVYAGVEAKLLDETGRLDLPDDLAGIDYIYAADHQFPLGDRVYKPGNIRAMLRTGQAKPRTLISSLIKATASAVLNYDHVVVAHLFSILPKVGLSEDQVPEELLYALAQCVRLRGASIEISERWQCPSLQTVQILKHMDVTLTFSTDAHRKEAIGRYDYCLHIRDQLRNEPSGPRAFPSNGTRPTEKLPYQ